MGMGSMKLYSIASRKQSWWQSLVILLLPIFISACTSHTEYSDVLERQNQDTPQYLIGPGDMLQVFVWGNADLTATTPVRPDGRITTPLVEDVVASGKAPSQLARDIERRLSRYIKKPVVTVTVTQFVGIPGGQIRVVGQVQTPQTIPYRKNLSLLDVIIKVGGLTEFAAGNDATIVRNVDGTWVRYQVKLEDLTQEGNLDANVMMQPGDVLFVPESWF